MEWSRDHDINLCREVLVVEPFRHKKGSVERGKAWTRIADALNSCSELEFKVNMRSVRERFTLIQKEYIKRNRQDEQSFGTSNEVTELDVLLEEITEKEKAAEEHKENDSRHQKNTETDRAKAEEMRKIAMERVRQTKRRKSDEGEN